jgi:hypothetical protein
MICAQDRFKGYARNRETALGRHQRSHRLGTAGPSQLFSRIPAHTPARRRAHRAPGRRHGVKENLYVGRAIDPARARQLHRQQMPRIDRTHQ